VSGFVHESVLLRETVDAMAPREGEIFVDLTLGGGGHAERIVEQLGATGLLIGLDRDPRAIEAASERLARFGDRVRLYQTPFAEMGRVLSEQPEVAERGGVDGVLFDLGVSSPQIDTAERGFSYRFDAPLDMRMGPDAVRVDAWLDTVDEGELARVLRVYGEMQGAGRLARSLLAARRAGELQTTRELVAVVEKTMGRWGARSHPPSTLVFQALRIAVNDEMGQLEALLAELPRWVRPGGRAAGISFHSLEDRPLKHTFDRWTRSELPPGVPVRGVAQDAPFEWVVRSVVASEDELGRNPRARSARLRVVRRRSGVGMGGRS
jgi:16S rRNA (cytosine1402-N4)-methyltransferase